MWFARTKLWAIVYHASLSPLGEIRDQCGGTAAAMATGVIDRPEYLIWWTSLRTGSPLDFDAK